MTLAVTFRVDRITVLSELQADLIVRGQSRWREIDKSWSFKTHFNFLFQIVFSCLWHFTLGAGGCFPATQCITRWRLKVTAHFCWNYQPGWSWHWYVKLRKSLFLKLHYSSSPLMYSVQADITILNDQSMSALPIRYIRSSAKQSNLWFNSHYGSGNNWLWKRKLFHEKIVSLNTQHLVIRSKPFLAGRIPTTETTLWRVNIKHGS